MDCNKEEAARAKDIAEVKMQGKDFSSAKKLLLKALNLSPDIENASHMLTVCEVHCSAGNLINGHTDHYGILQVEVSADESLIRKQYRKLALLLHPDKNKFAGAEAAFKLVSEAYKVLSDQTNRQVYDAKRRVQMRTGSWKLPQNAKNTKRYTAATFNVQTNPFGGLKPQDQQSSSSFFSAQCFWTMCLFCNNRFQYSRAWLNREVQCQKCFRKFLALEVSPQNVPPPGSSTGCSWSRTGFQETATTFQFSYNHGNQTHAPQVSKPEAPTNNGYGSKSKKERLDPCGPGMAGNPDSSGSTKTEKESSVKPSTGNARKKRNRRIVDSDSAESDSSDSDIILEVDPTVLDDGPTSSRYPRRSNRNKVNVTYKEDESEDDVYNVLPRKRLRKMGSSYWKNQNISSPEVVVNNGVKMKTSETHISEDRVKVEQTGDDPHKDSVGKKDDKQVRATPNANSAVGSRSRKPQAGSSVSYPDPEFYDFDKDRDQSKFAVNQIWAVYDDDDGMPRYYALIQKVFSPCFKLQYVWLESNPTSTAEKVWVKAGLPIACGNFTPGSSFNISKSREMFSHVIFCEKSLGNMYNIYPKRGEVWALFKDWDIGWSSPAEKPKTYVYEFVKVVSDFEYGKDISVCHLVKVNGFRYLFTTALDKDITVMSSGQLLKFSHCIPFYKVCEEREGIPGDSFEFDPAALPESLVTTMDADSADAAEVLYASGDPATVEDKLAGGAINNKNSSHSQNDFESNGMLGGKLSGNSDVLNKSDKGRKFQHGASEFSTDHRSSESIAHNEWGASNLGAETNEEDVENSSSSEEEYPNSEFYNFQDMRSQEKFGQGQIWALYCNIDEYPKFYAWVKKVDWERSGIHFKWLELQPATNQAKLWFQNELPFGCGRFKVVSGIENYFTTEQFSHMVRATPIKKNDLYEIYPNPGEIWAIYKNWSLKWTSENIKELADFNLVEIILRNEIAIKAVTLTKVKGYNYVFMPGTRGEDYVEIPMDECLKFSHQIPAFRLTNLESGKLRDCWELDPDSIPKSLLIMDFAL